VQVALQARSASSPRPEGAGNSVVVGMVDLRRCAVLKLWAPIRLNFASLDPDGTRHRCA